MFARGEVSQSGSATDRLTRAILQPQKLRCYNGGMTNTLVCLARLSDTELLTHVMRLASDERRATAHLIASLMELDTRRLHLGAGCSSLFTYCTQVLHQSEHAAYGRIEAARATRKFPLILDLLADGSITLTTVGLLASVLTAENHRELLETARHKSKREVESEIARLRPKPEVPPTIRKLPTPKPSETPHAEDRVDRVVPADPPPIECSATTRPHAPKRPAVVSPLTPERYKVQFTVSRETCEKLRRAQDLLRHKIPNGDPAAILDLALTLLIGELEKQKLAATARPRTHRTPVVGSRHVPAAVRRAVWARDSGRCAFIGTSGRCTETGLLEFHHVVPYASGGAAVAKNVELRCRAHNAYEAKLYFGPKPPLRVREERSVWPIGDATRSGPSSRRKRGYQFSCTLIRRERTSGVMAASELQPFERQYVSRVCHDVAEGSSRTENRTAAQFEAVIFDRAHSRSVAPPKADQQSRALITWAIRGRLAFAPTLKQAELRKLLEEFVKLAPATKKAGAKERAHCCTHTRVHHAAA